MGPLVVILEPSESPRQKVIVPICLFVPHFTNYFGPTEQIVIQFRIIFTVEILFLKISKCFFHNLKSHVSYNS
jgi:hypothetical protein